MLPIAKLPSILEKNKILNQEELEKLRQEAECQNLTLEECVLKKRLVTPELLYKAGAAFFNLPYVNLLGQFIAREVLSLIPEPIARTHQIVAYAQENSKLKLALLDPEDLQTLDFLEKKTGCTLELALTDPESLNDALKQYKKSLEAEFEEIAQASQKPIEQLAQEAPIIRIVDTIVEHAILRGASDIHLEARLEELSIRFRIDGLLQEAMVLPKAVHPGVIARIKILANLKIDEHRLPQDGRFQFKPPTSHVFSIRVSVFPMFDGEKIVLRLLQEDLQLLSIRELGLEAEQLKIVDMALQKPRGIILVTGPTGSGKTTTLYSFLTTLNKPQVNISTIEDPIEYRLPGINQSQVNPRIGFTFAAGLRSLLRQDPNIIMVGEIRDSETADIAINAALTGHLVISTLHTSDALTAIPRLLDLQVPAFLIAQTTSLITAQRLLRRICQHCLMSYTLNPETLQELQTLFDLPTILATLKQDGLLQNSVTSLKDIRFFKGAGCTLCGETGYRGRLAVHEMLPINEEMSTLIYERAPLAKLKAAVRKQGLRTLTETGFLKAKQGLTTIAEIIRVMKE